MSSFYLNKMVEILTSKERKSPPKARQPVDQVDKCDESSASSDHNPFNKPLFNLIVKTQLAKVE